MTIKNMNEYAAAFNANVKFTPPEDVTEDIMTKLKKGTFNKGKPALIQLNNGTCKWARVQREAAVTAEVIDGEVVLTGAYYLCDVCGKWAAIEECEMQGNGVACIICRDDTVQCDVCGEWVPEDDVVYVQDDVVCIDCVDENSDIMYCEHCERYTYSPYGTYYVETRHGSEGWCGDCFDYYATSCAECGDYIAARDAIWDDRREQYYCPCCYDSLPSNLIRGYHSGNPNGIQFHGNVTKDSYLQGYIGYELEYRGDGDRIAEAVYDAVGGFDFCHFEDDSTVDVEIVGQPHTLEMMYHDEDVFRAMFDAARRAGAYTHERAGLHVHFSRTCFGSTPEERAERIAKVCMLFSNNEAFGYLARIARRDDFDWCRQVTGNRANINHRAENIGGAHSVAVNLEHGQTVEFRLGRSMDTWEDFIAWIEVLAYIVRKSADVDETTVTAFENWFFDAPTHIRETLAANDIYISAPVAPLTVADYEMIIGRLCSLVHDAHYRRNTILSNIGLECNELPPLPTVDEIVRMVTPSNMYRLLCIGEE